MKPSGHYEEFSDRQRYTDMAIVATCFLPVVGLFVFMGIESTDGFIGWVAALVAALSGGLIVFLIYRKKQIFVCDPESPVVLSEDDVKAQAEANARWEQIEKQWWYRYPVAGLMFLGAWFLWEWAPKLWWVSVIGVLYGLILAKELSLVGIGIALAVAIFYGLATIPVSVAIIIGALIIAGAVKK